MNVYYLPTRHENDTPEIPPTASPWSVLQARAHRAWWRMRLTLAEVYAAVRRGGRNPLEEHIWIAADEMPAPRRRPAGPARILDLDAARRRRALAAAAV
jgi:hypothetical protein